ncbi:MAG: Flp pilus assembly protein CpaB, partial [Anaerolineae bacterium]|nr:Flp pilus assembly protein CpaB [Anaerolineae bacterium]
NNNPAGGGTAPLPGGTQVAQPANPQATAAPATPAPTSIPTIQIVVATQRINRGQRITSEVIALREWPDTAVPASALLETELVVGKIARTDIERESPIKSTDITESLSNLAAVGSDAAALLPPGTRMVAVPIDQLTSAGYALQPGDRVDIIMSSLFVDLDEDFQSMLPNDIQFIVLSQDGFTLLQPVDGRFDTIPFSYTLGEGNIQSAIPVVIRPNEPPRPRLVTQMTVQDALVIYVGELPEDGRIFRPGSENLEAVPATDAAAPAAAQPAAQTTGTPAPPPRPDMVAIAVSPQEAMVLTYLIETRVPITFALRPAGETGLASVQQVDLDYLMNAYRITVPRKLPYGLEPAIRSIRQLVETSSIQLADRLTP